MMEEVEHSTNNNNNNNCRYDEPVECPECGSHSIVHDYEKGELYCGSRALLWFMWPRYGRRDR